jgi:hypothetical protein
MATIGLGSSGLELLSSYPCSIMLVEAKHSNVSHPPFTHTPSPWEIKLKIKEMMLQYCYDILDDDHHASSTPLSSSSSGTTTSLSSYEITVQEMMKSNRKQLLSSPALSSLSSFGSPLSLSGAMPWYAAAEVDFTSRVVARRVVSQLNGMKTSLCGVPIVIVTQTVEIKDWQQSRLVWEKTFFTRLKPTMNDDERMAECIKQFDRLVPSNRPDTLRIRYVPRYWFGVDEYGQKEKVMFQQHWDSRQAHRQRRERERQLAAQRDALRMAAATTTVPLPAAQTITAAPGIESVLMSMNVKPKRMITLKKKGHKVATSSSAISLDDTTITDSPPIPVTVVSAALPVSMPNLSSMTQSSLPVSISFVGSSPSTNGSAAITSMTGSISSTSSSTSSVLLTTSLPTSMLSTLNTSPLASELTSSLGLSLSLSPSVLTPIGVHTSSTSISSSLPSVMSSSGASIPFSPTRVDPASVNLSMSSMSRSPSCEDNPILFSIFEPFGFVRYISLSSSQQTSHHSNDPNNVNSMWDSAPVATKKAKEKKKATKGTIAGKDGSEWSKRQKKEGSAIGGAINRKMQCDVFVQFADYQSLLKAYSIFHGKVLRHVCVVPPITGTSTITCGTRSLWCWCCDALTTERNWLSCSFWFKIRYQTLPK